MDGQTSTGGSQREKSTLEKNYDTALFSHRWLTCQLQQILGAINTLSLQSSRQTGENGRSVLNNTSCHSENRNDFHHYLVQIAKHLDFLLKFDDCETRDLDCENLDAFNFRMNRVINENLDLKTRLADVTAENQELKGQLDDVENLIVIATDLKNENELLIADYNRFKVCFYITYCNIA